MSNEFELFTKILFPGLSIIISLFGLRSGWTYRKDKLFTSRKNMSEFAYYLYKNSEDVIFKNIAEEYGIAALTKDKSLTKNQRLTLLRTINPVRDIDDFSKCQSLISISTQHDIFCWNKKRYKFRVYRRFVKLLTTSIYFMSSLLVALPFNYSILFSIRAMEKISHFNIWQKIGLSSYLITLGLMICFICLNKVSKIKIAERLILTNRL
ncbi:hypothetical protein KFZ77_14975 [Siccibacter colletis]|uniref:Uncharacterized protein n=2 Tax=Siccibacter colletis TaxID=1505757 RepID=A0ABY6JBB6_9ENTR|nr:hypothetical protein KFZ77_14975 [Siccibacter colletis]